MKQLLPVEYVNTDKHAVTFAHKEKGIITEVNIEPCQEGYKSSLDGKVYTTFNHALFAVYDRVSNDVVTYNHFYVALVDKSVTTNDLFTILDSPSILYIQLELEEEYEENPTAWLSEIMRVS